MSWTIARKVPPLDPLPKLADDFHSLKVAKQERIWAFGAIAELVDAALLRTKSVVQIECFEVEVCEENILVLAIQDDGSGVDLDELRSICSLAVSSHDVAGIRGCAGAILRLAKHALVLSKYLGGNADNSSSANIALLSAELRTAENTATARPLLPMVRVESTGDVLEGGEAGPWIVGQRIEASITS